jgi:MFS family permease
MKKVKENQPDIFKKKALIFIVLLGVVSLLADMTYEGARSITGPYLAILGSSALVVGLVAGLGELLGYSLRLLSGYLTDRTKKYWTLTILGYVVNLLAVPLLALAVSWQMAAVLMVIERMGKAIRTPPRDVMLSHATSSVGRGWGFGLHEALDQIGAITGPLLVALILYWKGSYQASFAFLLLPALLALATLIISRFLYPHPHELEVGMPHLETKGFQRAYWIYMVASALIAIGFADFPLLAFHFQKTGVLSPTMIPIFYAVAMGVDAVAALTFGRLFDRIGVLSVALATVLSSLFAPLVFLGSFKWAFWGMVLWGVGMGAQESVMRAAIAQLSPIKRRGVAYGLFNTVFGVSWFVGSFLMGFLYDLNPLYLVVLSMASQLMAIPFLIWTLHK